MRNFDITSAETLDGYARKIGFLPFFKNSIRGFSVEEMCPPSHWFTDKPGPWEWKGPVIRKGDCAYGKFFKNKAVYVSLEMLPHLCNYRRDGYDFDARCDDGLVYYRDKEIYDVLGTDAMGDESADEWISKGRHLFEADDDYYSMPYCTVFDEDYMKLAPWSDAYKRANKDIQTSKELTDFAVDNFASEEKNREYRKNKSEN